MNIRRHLLSNVFRSPDDPAIDPPAVDPVDPPVAVAADPPAPAAPAAGDPPADPPAPAPEPKPPGWWLTRLAEESEAKRQAELRATRAEEQLRARPPVAGDPPPAPQTRTIATDSPEFNDAVTRRANEIKLGEDSSAVLAAGIAKFPDFGQAVDLLSKLNVTHDEFVMDLIAADRVNGHLILNDLAKHPETAISLSKMPSRQRIAELVRMSTALAPKAPATPAPAAPTLSKAPKPAPALAPVGDGGGDDPLTSDAGTDDEFYAAWKKKYMPSRASA